MKKVIKHIVKFTSICMVVYACIMFVLCNVYLKDVALIYRVMNYALPTGKYSKQRFDEFSKQNQYQVVFLGSSHAMFHYDTQFFEKEGYTAYNLGTQNQSIVDSYLILKNYINSKNCDVVLMDFYASMLTAQSSDESSINLIAHANKTSLVKDIILEHREPKFINSALVRVFTMRAPFNEALNDSFGYYRGSVFSKKTVKGSFQFGPSSNKVPAVNRVELAGLDKLLKQAKLNGVNVALCSSYQYSQAKAHPYLFFLADSVCQANNVPFLDLTYHNNLVFNHDFSDGNHLNYFGEQQYNRALLDSLRARKILK